MDTIVVCIGIVLLVSLLASAFCKVAASVDRESSISVTERKKNHENKSEENRT